MTINCEWGDCSPTDEAVFTLDGFPICIACLDMERDIGTDLSTIKELP